MFNAMGGYPSLSDIAAVTKDGDGTWGGNGGWWIIIILFAIFAFGGNGNGLFGRGNVGTAEVGAEVQRGFDTQTIVSKLDGINYGISSLGYDQLAQMNNLNNNVTQTGYQLQNQLQQQTIAQIQDVNSLSRQLADCCCENRQAIAQVRYDDAANTCAITTAISNAARDIVENANCNYRALHEENVQARLDAKDETIAQLRQSLNDCGRETSNQALAGYIVSQLKPPCPTPSYSVPNPNWPWGFFEFINGVRNSNSCNSCSTCGQFA